MVMVALAVVVMNIQLCCEQMLTCAQFVLICNHCRCLRWPG